MLNQITLQGNLTADPELKKSKDGVSYCHFTIAVNRPRRKGADKEADFFHCVAWRGTAEIIAQWFHKSEMIIVAGSLRNYTWLKNDEKRVSTQVLVKEVHFSGGGKTNSREEKSELPTTPPELENINDFDLDEFEEILSGADMPF